MKYIFLGVVTSLALSFTITSPRSFAEPGVQRSSEMEFDARVIQGQRAEGAVYLFQRAARPLPPLLSYKRDYLGAIVSPVFDRQTSLGKMLQRGDQKRLRIGEKSSPTPKVSQSPQTQTKVKKTKLKKSKRKGKRSSKKSQRKKWRRSKKR